MQTYRELVNSGLADMDKDDVSVDVADSQFTLVSMDGNIARVRPDRLRIAVTAKGDEGTVEWDGTCMDVDTNREQEHYCLGDDETIGPFTPLERLDYLVAVRADGGWKLSLSRTSLTMVADMLSWVGDGAIRSSRRWSKMTSIN